MDCTICPTLIGSCRRASSSTSCTLVGSANALNHEAYWTRQHTPGNSPVDKANGRTGLADRPALGAVTRITGAARADRLDAYVSDDRGEQVPAALQRFDLPGQLVQFALQGFGQPGARRGL